MYHERVVQAYDSMLGNYNNSELSSDAGVISEAVKQMFDILETQNVEHNMKKKKRVSPKKKASHGPKIQDKAGPNVEVGTGLNMTVGTGLNVEVGPVQVQKTGQNNSTANAEETTLDVAAKAKKNKKKLPKTSARGQSMNHSQWEKINVSQSAP
ncbi:hypothetical protein HN51_014544 [Arachis hypogaea]